MKHGYLKYIIRHIIVWTIAFALFTFLREFGQNIITDYRELSFLERIRIQLAVGIVAGVLFGSVDYFFEKKIIKKVAFGQVMMLGLLSYILAIFIFMAFGVRVFTKVLGVDFSWLAYQDFIFSKDMIVVITYCLIVGFLIDFFKQVDKKFGPGNLWKMLKGEFHSPKEDERIFMFLDLKSSTTIAEQLGHLKYSKFIQDCFYDLDVAAKYRAEVYQYVGDEVVLTWEIEKGLKSENCLKAYFAIEDQLNSKSDYYMKKYGVKPEFKAGMNIGEITIAEVGEIKREIAYHGDTINTAARIQEKCNAYHANLLISDTLKEELNGSLSYTSSHVGNLVLKGKKDKVNIYRIDK